MLNPPFLPMSREELQALEWPDVDVLLVTGDAYVDHPAFGAALIGRFLVSQGFRVGIIAQPDWTHPESVTPLGRPRLWAGITAGAMDSMVANYTANKKLRRDDAYSPGGAYGLRPNRASLVYSNLIRHAFPKLPVVLGGIEASLRRMAHYDYWDDAIRRSLLLDAKADLLVYGMGEYTALAVTRRIAAGKPLEGIPGTATVQSSPSTSTSEIPLIRYEELLQNPKGLLANIQMLERHHSLPGGPALIQAHGQRWVVIQPPAQPLTSQELDAVYALPFTRRPHPRYPSPIPALLPVKTSVATHRGCFGGCSFCALGAHQGKIIQSRSRESILAEIRRMAQAPDFDGTIRDVGGPSANMYGLSCQRPSGPCAQVSCLFPRPCPHLKTDQQPQIELLTAIQALPKIKHVFVASGIRYDLALEDRNYIPRLVAGGHISGALKIAPEHVDDKILVRMRKPAIKRCDAFLVRYRQACQACGRNDGITAYFIASFPGSSVDDMQRIRAFARRWGLRIESMQDFIPLPMTLAGAMHYAQCDAVTGQPLTAVSSLPARQAQRRALLGRQAQPRTPGTRRKPDRTLK